MGVIGWIEHFGVIMSEKNQCEMYIKENNLLQLALFYFGRKKLKKRIVDWEDDNGSYSLMSTCEHGLPGSREQDVYTAAMRIWVKQGMPSGKIEITYSEIARILKLKDIKGAATKIKKSLKKLGGTRYEFNQCFVKADEKGNKNITTQFSLFDSTELFDYQKGLSKKKGTTLLVFPDIIRENLEARYYQRLDMLWYRSLPEGLSRRLYEYLTKRSYHKNNGNVFAISEEALCRWLPINDQHTTNRRRRLEEIASPLVEKGFLLNYYFDSQKKHCVFVYAKNPKPPKSTLLDNIPIEKDSPKNKAVPEDGDPQRQVMFIEVLDWISSIPYFQKKKRKKIASLPMKHVIKVYPSIRKDYEESISQGKRLRPSWIYDKFMSGFDNEPIKPKKKLCSSNNHQMSFSQMESNEGIDTLLDLVRKKTKTTKEKIAQAFSEFGFEYVKNNILYTNENAKKSYVAYLSQALKENWGASWAEEKEEELLLEKKKEKELLKKQQAKLAEENRKKEEALLLEKHKLEFKKKVISTSKIVRNMLWEQANKMVDDVVPGRSMLVKIEYSKLLLKVFNDEGDFFPEEAVSELNFIKDISSI